MHKRKLLLDLKAEINKHTRLKKILYGFIMNSVKTRPNWWIQRFSFLYIKKGKGSVIYRNVRKDLPPFNHFSLGSYSVIESFSCINNAVGDLIIGNNSRVGIGNTVIGPVTIGNNVNISQNVTITGLNHQFTDINKYIDEQGIITNHVQIEDDVWIGANSVVLPGVKIGRHSIIGAGSIVVKDIPPYSVCVGNPARIIKHYDFTLKKWMPSV